MQNSKTKQIVYVQDISSKRANLGSADSWPSNVLKNTKFILGSYVAGCYNCH